MKTHKILFLPHNQEITVPDGQTLIRAAMEAGVHINASCGGEGVCGKCRVIIEEGNVDEGITEKLNDDDLEKGYRLACKAIIRGDVTVRVPVESEVDASVLNMQRTARRTAQIVQPNFEDLKEQGLFIPPVEKIYLELPEPSVQDNLPDTSRLVSFLKLNHDEHRLVVSLPVIRQLPDIMRKDNFRVTATLVRPVQKGRKSHIIRIEPGDTTERNYAIAIDIGTTTIYGQLIDLKTGESLAEAADFNGQISYGEDVITRIVYAEKSGGLEKLHDVVVGTMNKIIKKIIRKARVERDEISSVTLAGNTTMTQLLLKVNPRYMRRSPYVPAATIYPPINAASLGLDVGEHAAALVYPQISSYVGGDIVAGVMGSGMYRNEELTLFMDIGTNAEIVIGNKDWLACAACSAGPAFEGGGIQFGMRAAKGAIEDFSINPLTLEPMNITIGNVRAKGICGSGLIIMVATMFEMGILDSQGKFNRDLDTSRIRQTDGIWEYVVVWQEDTQIDRDIVITEVDIENLIRAKGAIYSGCQTLLDEVGMDIDMVERIILAGGFGSYVDLEKSMTIGLLPEMDPDKITFIGNSSLMGARMSALSNHIRSDVTEVTRKMTNFELSETRSYMDHYVAALFLPHTDIAKFPKLKARLENRAQ
ncbi:ASKHA domain-containing protein [Desulfonema magnum]|uniref:2Fe-2S ferredoxin iron-sulfur binding and RACo domains-containing n=1 Tax=Desulfonema magnum TaxID=45655 RepID=A0A975GQI5_9BACT|nr:ASKHA domain-containing protein [Desulfonema magnum]QTA89940.1 2Fe-2S ferredoxin iron-sulfur binding and RACo domains-containing [Desulfonema magnum]